MSDKIKTDESRMTEFSPRGDRDNDTIELGELFAIIKAHKNFIFIAMAVSFFVAIFYILQIAPQYESTALIQVENKSEGMSSMLKSLDPDLVGFSGVGTAQPSDIETALIGSRFILQPTIDALGLNISVSPKYFPFYGAYISHHYAGDGLNSPLFGLSKYPWGGEKIGIKRFVVPLKFYSEGFVVEIGKNGTYKLFTENGNLLLDGVVGVFIESGPKSKIPGVKILVSDYLARQGVKFSISLKPMIQAIDNLSKNLSISDLASQGKAVTRNFSQTGILNVSLKGSNADLLPKILNTIIYYDIEKNTSKKTAETQKTLSFLDEQVATLRNDLDKASSALSEYKSSQGMLGVRAASQALLDQMVDMGKSLEELRLKKAQLLQEFTPLHPYVIEISDQQEKLKKELLYIEKQVKALPKAEQQTISLERDVRVKSQLYLLMLSKFQQVQVVKAGTISDVRVLGLATPSVRLPSKSPLILFGSLLFGFVFAVLFIFLRLALSKTLDDPDYIEERLGISLYAIIPFSKRQSQLTREMKRKIPGSGPFVLSSVNNKDLAIEGLRSLRTTLQFCLQEAKNNIIAILGSSPFIGKSFVCLNLTYVFADSGKKVLLIDADMRRGKISSYLNKSNFPGLADLLSGKVSFEQAKRVLKDGQIDFIPTGKYPENPSELLFDEKLDKLLEKLSPMYDLIIIDTPPVLAVTDSMLIAKRTAINLLLVGSGIENLRSLEHTVKRIQKNHIKIDGLILNSVKKIKHTYGYVRGGYYYYDYNSDDKKK